MKTYNIKEIFGPTIMGEGSKSGEVVYFIRFANCNRWSGQEKTKKHSICHFCDTDFINGTKMTVQEVYQQLENLKYCYRFPIVISGGEPLLQLDEYFLSTLVNSSGVGHIYLETNGSLKLPNGCEQYLHHVSMSPKQSYDKTKLLWCDDLKILYPPIDKEITPEKFASLNCQNRFVQPVENEEYQKNVNDCCEFLYNNPRWKLSLQIHKTIGVK